MADEKRWDVIVVGGGLGGLLSATLVAKGQPGRRVLLLERAAGPGGRAKSQIEAPGYVFNLGPHALYRGGPAAALLRRLGIPTDGGVVRGTGGMALDAGRLHTLPAGPVSLLTTDVVRGAGRLELAGTLARLLRRAPTVDAARSIEDWLEEAVRHADARNLLRALVRLSSYTPATDRLSAPAALSQLRLALTGGVVYLHRGWGRLVEGARARAEEAGVSVALHARAEGLRPVGDGVELVRGDGETLRAAAVVLAVPPDEALRLLPPEGAAELRTTVGRFEPVRAACLDLGLGRLPLPRRLFALGIDAPHYASVHSAWAELAPKGGATLQVARYLRPGEDGVSALAELEDLMDRWQPGWREEVRARRFLPNLTVMHALPSAELGGLGGRPPGALRSLPAVQLVGDWVGPRGMLLDAVAASAEGAAARLADLRRARDAAA